MAEQGGVEPGAVLAATAAAGAAGLLARHAARRRAQQGRGRVTPTPGLRGRDQRAQVAVGEGLITGWAPTPILGVDQDTGEPAEVGTRPGVGDLAGLAGSRVLRVECPRLGAWEVHLELAPGMTVADVRQAAGRLESILRLPPEAVEVARDRRDAGRAVLRFATTPTLLDEPVPWPGLPPRPPSVLDPCPVGAFPDGTPVAPVLAYVHVLVTGTTGAGKSGLLNVLLAWYAACEDTVVWGVDRKRVELAPWEPVLDRIARTEAEAELLLEAAARVVAARERDLERRGLRKWKPSRARPVLVIVIDEHAELATSQRCIDALKTITAKGRAVGVWVTSALQKAVMGAFGTRTDPDANLIPDKFLARFCGLVASAAEARVALGEGATAEGWRPERLDSGPGTFYLRFLPQFREPRAFRVAWMDDEQVAATVQALAGAQPQLDPPSAAGAAAPSDAGVGCGACAGGDHAHCARRTQRPGDPGWPTERCCCSPNEPAPPASAGPATPLVDVVGMLAAAGPAGLHWQQVARRLQRSRAEVYRLLRAAGAEPAGGGVWRLTRAGGDVPARAGAQVEGGGGGETRRRDDDPDGLMVWSWIEDLEDAEGGAR